MTQPSRIHIEDTAQWPRPGWTAPSRLEFSPDDRYITYLHSPEGGLVRQLFAFDTQTGEQFRVVTPPGGGASEDNLSLEEKLRRERQRQMELGVTHYQWAPAAQIVPAAPPAAGVERLLVPFPDGMYIQEGLRGSLRKIVNSSGGPLLDARFSPDGQWIAYVQNNELWVVSSDGGQPKQVTHEARESGRTHGLAEYVAQEEMHRSEGYWWSPDSAWLAFEEVDETHIPVYRIVHQGSDALQQEHHRYPFAGQPNAKVRLGVISREGGEPVWMDLGENEDIYLARVRWRPEGMLTAQIENREQTLLDLVRFDPHTGKRTAVLQETSEVWINLHHSYRPINKGKYTGGFIWASERTGYRHLYLYNRECELLRALTSGSWMVDELAAVDEENGMVYFTGTLDSPLEQHLYCVPLDGISEGSISPAGGVKLPGSLPRRITQAPGTHDVVLDHACKRFIDTHSALDTPPHIDLRMLGDGSLLSTIYENDDPRVKEIPLAPPERVRLQSRDEAILYGALYRPGPEYGTGPYPTLIYVYGGPHAQLVTNSWRPTTEMRAQYLRQQGYLVFTLDNRGSARRGLEFEGAVKYNLGDLEVRDQQDGVRWLVDQGLADPNRVGIFGASYGGYMSAMCLARAPETFQAAVAISPVTHWDGYDTNYTERYMGTPLTNPRGYEVSAVMRYVEGMGGHLLLVHGLIDENVHFRHTARLINALIQARKPYELLLFPDERHSPRRLADRVYLEERIEAFFNKALNTAPGGSPESSRSLR